MGTDTYIEIRDDLGTTLYSNDDRISMIGCSEISATLTNGDFVLYVRHFAQATGTIANYFLDIDL